MREPKPAEAWDKEYLEGKYKDDEAIPFVGEIVDTLTQQGLLQGSGLYVGCGNGRNFIPLIRQGLRLTGLDISSQALRQLAEKEPIASSHLQHGDFLDYDANVPLDYLISIQIFQHGDLATATKFFDKTKAILKPGGLFFLRVNSVSTDIFFAHDDKEETEHGGITVTYSDGPKEGLDVHFYTEQELHNLTEGLIVLSPLHEVTMQREAPKTGQWTQWEGIWKN